VVAVPSTQYVGPGQVGWFTASAVPGDPDWNEEGHPIVRVTREQIADLVRAARRVIAF